MSRGIAKKVVLHYYEKIYAKLFTKMRKVCIIYNAYKKICDWEETDSDTRDLPPEAESGNLSDTACAPMRSVPQGRAAVEYGTAYPALRDKR
jgi:hypothetical protein